MACYYVGDTLLDIVLETNLDITLASELKIIYAKPSGVTGEWIAALEGTTQIKYPLQVGDIDEVGRWKVQSFVTIGGRSKKGCIEKIKFSTPLQ